MEKQVQTEFRHNATVCLLNMTFWQYSTSFINRLTILPLYVSHFTDSTILIGLLAAIGTAGWFLPQVFTANWIQRLPKKKDAPVRVGFFTERLPLLVLVAAGLLAEVKSLLEMGYSPRLKSMQSIGYRHMVAYLEGRLSWEEALQTFKRDTRRYAKRQLTWFKSDPQIH